MKRLKLCADCGHRHRTGFELCRIAKMAEGYGASVAWANEPDEFHHQITFTPGDLSQFVEGVEL